MGRTEMVAMWLEWDDGAAHLRDYERVISFLGMREQPPEGLIVHTAGLTPGGSFRVVDVWESRDHIEAFFGDVLLPAARTVLGASPDPPAMTEVYEIATLIRT